MSAWITWTGWPARILVDSDVLIEHLRGSTAARDWLVQARESSGPLAISVVSLTEIAGGMRSPERREVMRLLGSMQRFEVSGNGRLGGQRRSCGSTAGPIPGSASVSPIAATALTEGLELATLNVRHYPMFPGTCPALPDLKYGQPARSPPHPRTSSPVIADMYVPGDSDLGHRFWWISLSRHRLQTRAWAAGPHGPSRLPASHAGAGSSGSHTAHSAPVMSEG